jgi:hypothetical protein
LDLQQADLNYGFAKEQGLDAAARSDRAMDLRENLIATAYSAALGNQRAAMETRGFENQTAMVQGDSAVEGAYASLGASGVRATSSAAGAIERRAAVNDQAMQVALRSQERQNESALLGAYASLASGQAGIGEARYAADWTRKSFEEGGENYEKYEFSKKRIEETWRDQKELYQTAINNAEYTGWDVAFDALTGGLGGLNMGMNIYSFGDKYWWGKGTDAAGGTTVSSAEASTPTAGLLSYGPMADWNTIFEQNQFMPGFSSLKYSG